MADITRFIRSRNAHSSRNLVFGHFGTAKYDSAKEEWSFLRQGSEVHQNGDLPLKLLHAAIIPTRDDFGAPSIQEPQRKRSANPDRLPERHGLESVLRVIDDGYGLSRSQPALQQVKPIFCYALSPYELGTHRSLLPVVVALSRAGSLSMSVRAIRMNETLDLEQSIPTLDDSNSIICAPIPEPILGLSCSADKLTLAIRQRSATCFCRLVLHAGQLNPLGYPQIAIESILSLPISRTGGHPHTCTSFHPTTSSLVSIVDERGNWSVWRRAGRRKQSTRILSSLHLQNSGKLLPLHIGTIPQATQFYDGWYRICWLENASSGAQVILVCGRRVARIFNLDGSPRGDVDMCLGSRAANNHILEVQQSLVNRSICYVLTTTRIMAMQLSVEHAGTMELNILCSWTHFSDARNLDLDISVLELDEFRYVMLQSSYNRTRLFCMKTSPIQGLVALGDPQILSLPRSVAAGLVSSTIALQLFDIAQARRHRPQPKSTRMIKFVALDDAEQTIDLTFSCGLPDRETPGVAYFEVGSLRIASNQEWRIKSSRTVDDDDDLLDFLVLDKPQVQDSDSRSRNTLYKPSHLSSQTRTWQDLFNVEAAALDGGTATESLNLLERQAASLSREQETMHSIAELLNDFRIPDIEELSTGVEEWHVRSVGRLEDPPQRQFTTVVGTTTAGLSSSYRDVLTKFAAPISQDLPDRAKVQTERISRQVGFDVYASGVTLPKTVSGTSDGAPTVLEQNPTSTDRDGEPEPAESEDPIFAALRRYTTFNAPEGENQSSATTARTLAHLPLTLDDPSSYSYGQIEERLREEQSRKEFSQLSDSERRRAERTNLRNKKKLAQQLRQRDAAILQDSYIPGVSMMSKQADPRQIQSSQAVSDLPTSSQAVTVPMTQPERGAHGERKPFAKKSGKRTKGF